MLRKYFPGSRRRDIRADRSGVGQRIDGLMLRDRWFPHITLRTNAAAGQEVETGGSAS
jgi:hypothetical protein